MVNKLAFLVGLSDRKIRPIAKELITAKTRISDPDKWCQGAYEHDGKLCAVGAVGRTNYGAANWLNDSSYRLYGRSITAVNDWEGYSAVMEVFDHAIQRAISQCRYESDPLPLRVAA